MSGLGRALGTELCRAQEGWNSATRTKLAAQKGDSKNVVSEKWWGNFILFFLGKWWGI